MSGSGLPFCFLGRNNLTLSFFFFLLFQDVVRGDIERAIVFNYMFEPEWLLRECPLLRTVQRLTVLHGEGPAGDDEFRQLGLRNLTIHTPRLPLPYGTHHSKGMLLFYPAGIRVMITTGNFIARGNISLFNPL